MALQNKDRAYAAAHFQLELGDDKDAGILKSIEGGNVKVDVMTYQQGGIYDRWRQIGKPKFEDIKLQLGMSVGQAYYKWIEAFFTGNQDRKNGAIVAGDFSYQERARREFQFALIKEVGFPALDAQSKDALYMNVTVAVESIAFKPGGNNKLSHVANPKAQKLWKASDFKFVLNGYETSMVNKIDAITIKQNIIEYHAGGLRAPTKTPSQIDFPNVVFYLPESHAAPFIDRFMANGGAVKPQDPTAMADGMIQYYSSDLTTLNGILHLHNTEIVGVTPDKADSGSDNIKNVKVELFCEAMSWESQSTLDESSTSDNSWDSSK